MKNIFYLSVGFLLFTSPLFADFEKIIITFPLSDGVRKWKKCFHEEDQFISLTEYCLENETEQKWSELITTQYFTTRGEVSLEDFFVNTVRELAKNHPTNKIKSHIAESTADTIIGEWWIRDRSIHDQHEWVKIVKQDAYVKILRYTTKNMKQEAMGAKVWKNLLNSSHF